MDQDTTKAILELLRIQSDQIKSNRDEIKLNGEKIDKVAERSEDRYEHLCHELSDIKSLIQSKEFKKIQWDGGLLVGAGSFITMISVFINQLLFRLFP